MRRANFSSSSARISAGSCQLFVGPASSSRSEQMNVRSSTRATSPGSEQREVGVGALGLRELRRRSPARRAAGTSRSYSSRGAVAPVHLGRLVALDRVVDPVQEPVMRRRGGRFGGHFEPYSCPTRRCASPIRVSEPRRRPAAAAIPAACGRFSAGRRTITARRRASARRPLGHEHEALELRHEHAVLVEHPRVHLDRPAVGLGRDSRTSSTSDSANSVSPWKTGRRVAQLLRGEVGDRLAGDVGDAHAERERVDERADHDVAPLLGARGVHVVDVQRVVVHRDQAEQVVVGLGDGLGRPVPVDRADLELLEVAAVGVGAARLAGGLVGLDGARWSCRGCCQFRRASNRRFPRSQRDRAPLVAQARRRRAATSSACGHRLRQPRRLAGERARLEAGVEVRRADVEHARCARGGARGAAP